MNFKYLMLFILLASLNAFSLVHTKTDSGLNIYWPSSSPIEFYILKNTSQISDSDLQAMANISTGEWNAESQLKINPFLVTSISGKKNTLQFINSYSPSLGSGVVAVTSVSYSNLTGKISSANISINEYGFTFNNIPGTNPLLTNQIYLADVLTHELGHLLGLGHSEVLDSTMIFSAFKNQYDLAADDKSSIRTLYPATNFGTIQGRVMGGNSVPVFGAIVHAISAREGNVIASSISDDDGSFSITGLSLEDDNYYLYIKPPENINALPQYYSSVQTNFCPGSYRGSFFSSCNSEEKGFPQKISFLSTDSIIDLGNLTIKCDLRLNPSYLESKNAGGNANLTLLESTDNLSTNGGLSFIGYFYSNQVSSDKNNSLYDELLIDLRGETLTTGSDLKISLLGFSLGVKADYYVSVDKIDQFNITTNIQTDINNQQNLFIDLDADPNNNRFKLTIKPQSISLSNMKNYIPEPSVFSDSEYFYHLLLELVDDVNHDNFLSIVDSSIQDNSSCLEAPFTYAVDANTTVLKSDEKLSLLSATCGTIGPNDSDFSGPFNMMIGFLTIFLISHLRRWRKIV